MTKSMVGHIEVKSFLAWTEPAGRVILSSRIVGHMTPKNSVGKNFMQLAAGSKCMLLHKKFQ